MSTTRRKLPASCYLEAIARLIPSKPLPLFSTTPAASAKKPRKRFSPASANSGKLGRAKKDWRSRLRRAAGRREDLSPLALGEPGLRFGELQQAAGTSGAARSRRKARHRPRY